MLSLLRQGLSNTHKIHEQVLKELHSPKFRMETVLDLSFYSIQLQIETDGQSGEASNKWELKRLSISASSGNLMTTDSVTPKSPLQDQEKMKLEMY